MLKYTNKPITAIATHIHWDHIGGHAYFNDFYVQEEELDWLNGKFPLPLEQVKKMVVDRCTLPDDFQIDAYKIFQGKPTSILMDHTRIDLGGREVEVLHTPGHSPGHMCFWEKKCGYLFTGDLVYKGRLYAYYPSTDPAAYLTSLEKVLALPVERVFPAHHSLDIHPEIIQRMQNAFAQQKANGELHHGSGVFYHGDWSVWF